MRICRKSIILIILLFLVTNAFIYAEPAHYTKGVLIQGGYDDVAAINITPLAAVSEGKLMGMPFTLNDSSVLNGASEKGRLIAKWNVLTNRKFLLDISAEIMHPEDEEANKDAIAYTDGLGYILTFVYNMSYYADNKINYVDNASFKIAVPDSIDSKVKTARDINLLENVTLDDNSLVGSADGTIYFVFDESTTAILTDESAYGALRDGNYIAKVKMTVKVPQ